MQNETVSFIANPVDSRCQWWAVRIPAGFIQGVDLDDKASLRSLGFLKKGADIELEDGEAVLESEAVHHAKNRGYNVKLSVVVSGKLRVLRPGADEKAAMKRVATSEQWARLKGGSGDVAACLRALLFLEMADEAQLREVFPKTADVKFGRKENEVVG